LTQAEGVTDPERKRKIIGNEFIRVFEEEAIEIKNARFLARDFIPDVIESTSFKDRQPPLRATIMWVVS